MLGQLGNLALKRDPKVRKIRVQAAFFLLVPQILLPTLGPRQGRTVLLLFLRHAPCPNLDSPCLWLRDFISECPLIWENTVCRGSSSFSATPVAGAESSSGGDLQAAKVTVSQLHTPGYSGSAKAFPVTIANYRSLRADPEGWSTAIMHCISSLPQFCPRRYSLQGLKEGPS